jgi:DNA polymerase
MSRGLDEIIRLSEEYRHCKKCQLLCKSRTEVVFGSGSVRADLLVIGEAPGAEEDEEGIPFIGRSGRLLMDMFRIKWPETERMAEIRNTPDEEDDAKYFSNLRDYLDDHIFWTNVVLCRPENNRTPTAREIKECRDRLYRTIYAVDPMLILAAGKPAATALVGKTVGILDKRGTIFDIEIPSPVTGNPVRYPCMAILHPSYLLRKGDQSRVEDEEGDTYETLEDIGYALSLLTQQYMDIFGTSFPDKPEDYKI